MCGISKPSHSGNFCEAAAGNGLVIRLRMRRLVTWERIRTPTWQQTPGISQKIVPATYQTLAELATPDYPELCRS